MINNIKSYHTNKNNCIQAIRLTYVNIQIQNLLVIKQIDYRPAQMKL
jgi:hypothetical protein